MAVEFQDFSIQVKDALEDAVWQFLEESGDTLHKQAADNTRIGSGETAGKWTHVVDEGKRECVIGNPLENAIWEEFGTGEFALGGDGRRGGWTYRSEKDGKFHHTYGKTPTRALHNAFVTKKSAIIARAEQVLKGRMG